MRVMRTHPVKNILLLIVNIPCLDLSLIVCKPTILRETNFINIPRILQHRFRIFPHYELPPEFLLKMWLKFGLIFTAILLFPNISAELNISVRPKYYVQICILIKFFEVLKL